MLFIWKINFVQVTEIKETRNVDDYLLVRLEGLSVQIRHVLWWCLLEIFWYHWLVMGLNIWDVIDKNSLKNGQTKPKPWSLKPDLFQAIKSGRKHERIL